jgi:hypothetical protein
MGPNSKWKGDEGWSVSVLRVHAPVPLCTELVRGRALASGRLLIKFLWCWSEKWGSCCWTKWRTVVTQPCFSGEDLAKAGLISLG